MADVKNIKNMCFAEMYLFLCWVKLHAMKTYKEW
jgi:hypothetical protein